MDLFCLGGAASLATVGGIAVVAGTNYGSVPFVWTSTDGLRWTDRGNPFGDAYPDALAAVPGGFLVAGHGPLVWTSFSVDGVRWSAPAALPGVSASSTVLGMLERRGETIVFLADGSLVGVYRSADQGKTWHPGIADGLDGRLVHSVQAAGSRVAAVGSDDSGAYLWISSDGSAWRAVSAPRADGSVSMGSVGSFGGTIVVTGTVEGTEEVGAVWTAPEAAFDVP
jgi:hypothetical protein